MLAFTYDKPENVIKDSPNVELKGSNYSDISDKFAQSSFENTKQESGIPLESQLELFPTPATEKSYGGLIFTAVVVLVVAMHLFFALFLESFKDESQPKSEISERNLKEALGDDKASANASNNNAADVLEVKSILEQGSSNLPNNSNQQKKEPKNQLMDILNKTN